MGVVNLRKQLSHGFSGFGADIALRQPDANPQLAAPPEGHTNTHYRQGARDDKGKNRVLVIGTTPLGSDVKDAAGPGGQCRFGSRIAWLGCNNRPSHHSAEQSRLCQAGKSHLQQGR